MDSKKPILIVGAGLAGATIARVLADAGYRIHVIDKRSHVAGNAFDFVDENGIRIHRYGPHIFHTNNRKVVEWLSRFTDWIPYEHKVKALLEDGRYVTLPPNQETKEAVGESNIIDIFFRPYTKKMWGLTIEELNPDILKRVPIRDDMNDLYFPDDKFQFMPESGYTSMVENILQSDMIRIELDAPFCSDMESSYRYIFNSMPIDEYFGFDMGHLPYRSVKFHHAVIDHPGVLPVPTVNFTHDGPYTRMTEWKNYPGHGSNPHRTVITSEEPCCYTQNNLERYYPIKDRSGSNAALYKIYKERIPSHMTFIGRCGQYVYLDMHQAVSSSLAAARKFLEQNAN